MYTSSAYPTSIPSSGVVTRDHPAIDGRIETRRQDTTDGFPVGLIPQLIDVLNILTEGQALLSGKIRAARLNESTHSPAIVDQLDRLEMPVGQPVVVGSSSTSFETQCTRPAEHSERDRETTQENTSGFDCLSDPGVEVGGTVASPASVAELAPSSDTPEAVNVNVTSGPEIDPLPLESATPSGTTASPLHRDYNFFDELDARLASLQDPTG